ncbi:MAG: LytTR family transcriptional regulator [Firmicutes bacterium]|nr:LytTR family transcriptional regulator [Bacillota bacterium]
MIIYLLKIATEHPDAAMQSEIKELVNHYFLTKNLPGQCSLQDHTFISFHCKEKNGVIRKIRQENIIYIEKKGHKVQLYTHNGSFSFYSSLKKLEEILDPNMFLRVHQGYIVNLYEISYLHSEGIALISVDKIIPVSRRNQSKLDKMILFS